MKPVAIFRHAATEGPGYFATFLAAHDIPMRLFRIDAGEAVPQDASQFSGLVFMGGPMSVNDDLPWIPRALELVRQAVARDIPVLGHCLGGQLMAKALGGMVGKNPVKEFGWGEVNVADNPVAREWFAGIPSTFDVFHWHGETFSIPDGASRVLENRYCANQAFALGKHLGMQCHVEMTVDMIKDWCEADAEDLARHSGPSIQTPEEMLRDAERRVTEMNAIAAKIYSRWIRGLAA